MSIVLTIDFNDETPFITIFQSNYCEMEWKKNRGFLMIECVLILAMKSARHFPHKITRTWQLIHFYIPCSYGENVPASILMYGSIFIEVTSIPQQFSNVPNELAITPLPTPLITPPVTSMYFIVCGNWCPIVLTIRLHINWKRCTLFFTLCHWFRWLST